MAARVSLLLWVLVTSSTLFMKSVSQEHPGLDPDIQRNPVVKIEQGLLRGELLQSAAGGFFYSFKGIPYAQSPVGQLRFMDPEPPPSWDGVRDALLHGNVCPQPLMGFQGFKGDEDCLFLNVYTPQLPNALQTQRLPVMFYIHGGGYASGSGNSDFYGPDFLVSDGVVLVTVNYRLGPFGFLYLKEATHSNVGMKDQLQALRWVQGNIAAFRGDPTKVTIFGESSGASSVYLLMLSPMAKGFFHGAIGQSGHVVNKYHNSTERWRHSLNLADAVGCGGNTCGESSFPAACKVDPDVIECLRGINASTLTEGSFAIVNRSEQLIPFVFFPIFDTESSEVSKFLPASPIELIEKGLMNPVPYINGFNDKEAYDIFSLYNLFNESEAHRFDSSFQRLILPLLRLRDDSLENDEALNKLRHFYMDGKPLTNETIPRYLEMLTDALIGEGSYFTIRYMARYHKASIYQYIFTVDDKLNIMKSFFPFKFAGATHADDLGYLFKMDALPEVSSNSTAAIARAQMARLWTNFAKYGTPCTSRQRSSNQPCHISDSFFAPSDDHCTAPTSNSDLLHGLCWEPYTSDERNFLEIGSTLRLGRDLYLDRVSFWEDFDNAY